MEKLLTLNLSIALAGIVLCLLGILLILVGAKADKRTDRCFILIYLCLILFVLSNMTGLLLRGRPGRLVRAGLCVSNFCEFLFPCLTVYLVSDCLLSIVDPEREQRSIRSMLTFLTLVHVALLILSQFNGMYYVLDAGNIYHRSAWYPLSYIMTTMMILTDAYLLHRYQNRLTKREITAFRIYFIVPGIALVIQIFVYGISILIFSTIIAALAMYVFIISDQTERYYQKEKENTELRIDLMLSQIQPHFLFNSLWVIQEICRTDPRRAEKAIGQFSRFLRHNMDSLTSDKMILFTEELEHTRCYIELQQLRFMDQLKVEYDLACTTFTIPTLTLQPLVENAITYGVRKNESGCGTVKLQTMELADCYKVIVTDNGPGFTPGELPEGERSHIGIRNVRTRLQQVCGGSLQIVSALGKGTTATITLPKTDAAADRLPGRKEKQYADFCH